MTATIVLDQQQRNGTFDSSSLAVPVGNNPDTGQSWAFVRLGSTLSDTDALDAGKSCILSFKATWDGSTYQTFTTSAWTGGNRDRNGNPAGPNVGTSLPTDAGGLPPVRVMATLDTEGNLLNMGLTIGFS